MMEVKIKEKTKTFQGLDMTLPHLQNPRQELRVVRALINHV